MPYVVVGGARRVPGSLDSFHKSCLWGANPNALHTRDTIDCEKPRCSAIDRVDQWVAPGGVVSGVAVIKASICSSPTARGRPGRGSSSSPSQRSSPKWLRHFRIAFRSNSSRRRPRRCCHHRRRPTRSSPSKPSQPHWCADPPSPPTHRVRTRSTRSAQHAVTAPPITTGTHELMTQDTSHGVAPSAHSEGGGAPAKRLSIQSITGPLLFQTIVRWSTSGNSR